MSADQRRKTRTLWLSGVLHGFTHLYQIALVPLYLLIQKDLKLASVGEATLLVTVMGISYFLPSYPIGILADRMSRKKMLAIGLALNGLGFVLVGLAPNYAGALAGVVLSGLGGSFYHPAATALIARLYPVGTGRALGLVAIGASIGYFVGPIYTGWRAEMSGNWRSPVIELGIFGVIVAGIFYWLCDEDRSLAVDGAKTAIGSPSPPVGEREGVRGIHRKKKLFPTRALWLFFLAAAFCFSLRDFAGAGMGSLGSLYLQEARGFDPKTTGFMLSGIFLASAASNPIFGHLSDRGRIRWTILLLVLALTMIALFPHVPRQWMFVTLSAYGFFFLASYPVVEAAVMESVPDAVRGRVFGLFITAGGLVGNLAHWAVGVAVKKLGPDAALPQSYYPLYAMLAGLVVLSLAGLPCLHAIRKREEQADPAVPASHPAPKPQPALD
jgi:FSR family fosmidomycin resistance protein-like MFS transporter